MFDYPAIAALAAVIRKGSFETAARDLGVTASAVSQRVKSLEERLGAILVVRGQPCLPTEVARALCAHLERIRILEHDIAPALGFTNEVAPVTLRIAVNADSLATWFPAAAGAFGRQNAASLHLALDDEAHTVDRLRSGDVIAAVTADRKPVQGCRTIPLGALRYLACASPDYVERYLGDGSMRTAIASAPYLRFDHRDGLQERWAREALGVELSGPVHWIASTQGFLDLALRGLAWGLHPTALVETHLRSGRLVQLAGNAFVDVALFWVVSRMKSAAVTDLTSSVRAAALVSLMPPTSKVG